MKKYTYKFIPALSGVQVEATQFDVCDNLNWPKEVEQRYLDGEPTKMRGSRVEFFVSTPKGEVKVNDGDWIMNITGETKVCRPDLFKEMFKPVEE
jgi:hypothetical protein